MRNPVYDIRELQAMESGQNQMSETEASNSNIIVAANSNSAPNSLDKERNALNEDPRWQDTAYVLANYKTEVCKRPPRLCRQGFVLIFFVILIFLKFFRLFFRFESFFELFMRNFFAFNLVFIISY